MKKIIVSFLALSGLCAQVAAQTGKQTISTNPAAQIVSSVATNTARTANHNKFSSATRQFLQDWKDCQAAVITVQTAQSKAMQGTADKVLSNARLIKLQDKFGVQLLPAVHTTINNVNTSSVKTKAQNQISTYAFYVPVFVEFGSEEALQEAERHGLVVQTKLKTIATALILPDSLETIANITHINRIEVSAKVKTTLDSARRYTFVDSVHRGDILYGQNPAQFSLPYKGEGVVVGIVDVGFDYTHPTFFDAADATLYRVKRVWDQNATASGTLRPPTGKSYGVEYTTSEQILSAQHCKSDGSHGSHVAGIAGGSGAGTPYIGMAPKSDLVFVPTTLRTDAILDGVEYILNYAKSQKKPCVVNLSLGSHIGPLDNLSSLAKIGVWRN